MSTKKPTIKRILKEASELASQPSSDYHAAPLETDLFEWHFTIRGPPAPSPFEGGIYHGRIVLPPAYPLKPPSFRFLTPSGRFETNREICLSISGFHEETWQPAWGIRTALVAIRSFMDTEAKGQVGGMDGSEELRRRLAAQSKVFKCASCGKSNDEIMREQEAAAEDLGTKAAGAQDVVPEELRLAYREDLEKQGEESSGKTSESATPDTSRSTPVPAQTAHDSASTTPARAVPASPPTITRQRARRPNIDESVPAWIDKAIYGIIGILAFLISKKLLF